MERTHDPATQALLARTRTSRFAQLRDAREFLLVLTVVLTAGPAAAALTLGAPRSQAWVVLAGGVAVYAVLLAGITYASGLPSALDVVVARGLVAGGATPDEAADQVVAMSKADKWRVADPAEVAEIVGLPSGDMERRRQRVLAGEATSG